MLKKLHPRSLTFICLIFYFLNLFLKIFLININPAFMVHDELYYATEAQAIIANGTDLTGEWRPWQLKPSDAIYSELTSTVQMLGYLFFPNSPLLAAKFMPIILGSTIPISLGLIAYYLYRRKLILVSTILIATLNPWVFQFSRMAFDSIFSTSFYLIGLVILLYAKKWWKLVAFAPLLLGFFQYQGHKLLLVPLVGLTVLLMIVKNHQLKIKNTSRIMIEHKQSLIVFILCIFLLGAYLLRLPHISAGMRLDEISLINNKNISTAVDQRRLATLPSPWLELFENKFTIYLDQLGTKLIDSFNLKLLFIEGNKGVDTYAVTDYGFFHRIDLILMLIGLATIFQLKNCRKESFFIIALILIGVIPSIIKNDSLWLTFRNSFSLMGLILLTGFGLFKLIDMRNKYFQFTVIMIYTVLTTSFFHNYFYTNPLAAGHNNFFYERVLSEYIKRNPEIEITIYTTTPKTLFNNLLTYNSLVKDENFQEISEAVKNNSYSIANFKIVNKCFDPSLPLQDNQVVIVSYELPNCENQKGEVVELIPITISSIYDNGQVFNVYNDSSCNRFEMEPYIKTQDLSLDFDSLDYNAFCKSFFTLSRD